MANEFDYYLIDSIRFDDVPLLVNDDEFDSFGIGVLAQDRVMSSDFVGHIAFGPPVPPKPRLNDAMSLGGDCCVFSKKIHDVLNSNGNSILE